MHFQESENLDEEEDWSIYVNYELVILNSKKDRSPIRMGALYLTKVHLM